MSNMIEDLPEPVEIVEDIKPVKSKKVITKTYNLFEPINENVKLPSNGGRSVWLLKPYFEKDVLLEACLSDNTRVNKKIDFINGNSSLLINSGERVIIDTGLDFYPKAGSVYFGKSVPELVFEYNITSDLLIEDRLKVGLTNNSNARVRIMDDTFICELVIIEKEKENG